MDIIPVVNTEHTVALSPMLIYWWGLSNLDTPPVPSQLELTSEQRQIWKHAGEVGEPDIRKLNPYRYVALLMCVSEQGIRSDICRSEYSGARISSLSIRWLVADRVHGQGITVWKSAQLAYAIWVTRNWSKEEIISTYYEFCCLRLSMRPININKRFLGWSFCEGVVFIRLYLFCCCIGLYW